MSEHKENDEEKIIYEGEELTAEELELILEEEEKLRREREEMLEHLALNITSKFQNRAARRQVKESEWLEAQRLYLGKLSVFGEKTNSDNPFQGRQKRDRPDVNIVRSKTLTAIAQTVSQQFGTSDKNWDLFPGPANREPEAASSAQAMSDAIEQQLEKCKYPKKARRAMEDRAIIGTGILKGPVNTGDLRKVYEPIPGTDEWVPSITHEKKPSVEVVNPWFFYPDESTNDPEAIEDCIEVHPMSAFELKKYMNHPGFEADQIEECLKERPDDYINHNYSEYATLTESNPYLFKDKYLVLEYHGPITQKQLQRLEIEPGYESLDGEYYGEVWVCQGRVIRVELENIEACFSVPYFVSVWQKDPASVFGFGVPIMMRDAQRVVNETWHMILDNSSVSSGPQVAMQKNFIEPDDGDWEIGPRKVWLLNDPQVTVDQAMQFFNVPNVTPQLVPILDMARAFSEEESCIPLIQSGLTSPQPGDTATGGLMMQQASTTLLDFLGEDWDDQVTARLIDRMYGWNMQYNPDPAIKGDYSIDVRTSTEYKNKQLHIRDLERLSLEVSQNPQAAMMVNADELYRARLEMMNLPSKHIIRTPEEIAALQAQAQSEPSEEQIKMQVEMQKLNLAERELGLKEAELAFEMGQAQQREMWENEEKMAANYARTLEAEARVLAAQTEKEIELLKLAQKNDQFYQKLMADQQFTAVTSEMTMFQKAMEESRKTREGLMKHEREKEDIKFKKDMKKEKYGDRFPDEG